MSGSTPPGKSTVFKGNSGSTLGSRDDAPRRNGNIVAGADS